MAIAILGFEALNLVDPGDEFATRLAERPGSGRRVQLLVLGAIIRLREAANFEAPHLEVLGWPGHSLYPNRIPAQDSKPWDPRK